MRNLFAFVGAAVIAFLGLGWYLDWYKIQPVPNGSAGHQSFTVDFDQKKAEKDGKKFEKKVEKTVGDFIEKKSSDASTPAPAPSSSVPVTTPADPNVR